MIRMSLVDFSLSNDYAPHYFSLTVEILKNAQIFTLLHELGHLLLGESGVSVSGGEEVHQQHAEQQAYNERWCDSFAAHFLVPSAEITQKSTSITRRRG